MPRAVAMVLPVLGLLLLSLATIGTASGAILDAAHGQSDWTNASNNPAEETIVTECMEIREPGHYRLAEDLVNRTVNRCIEILASDVVFDGDGHLIDGVRDWVYETEASNQTTTKGLVVEDGPHTNVTIKHVEVSEFGYGIWVEDTTDGKLVNSTFRTNGVYGIYYGYDAHDNLIANNRIINTTIPQLEDNGRGIVIAHAAHRNVIRDNYIRDSSNHGIVVNFGTETTVVNNTVLSSGQHGITGEGSNGTEISGNVVRNSEEGIVWGGSSDVVIRDNQIERADKHGIRLSGEGSGITLDNNTIGHTSEWNIKARRYSGPVTVTDTTLPDAGSVSFTSRQVNIDGVSTPPESLPDGSRALGGYLEVWSSAGPDAWIDLELPYDDSGLDEGSVVDMYVHSDSWKRLPDSDVDRGTNEIGANVTGIDGSIHFVVGASSEDGRPETDDSASIGGSSDVGSDGDEDESTDGDGAGFGVVGMVVSIVVTVVAGLRLRSRCE